MNHSLTKLKDKMDKKVINTKEAPAPIGPYQQAIMAGNTLYISGQIAIDVETDQLIKGDIQAETHQVMKNLKAILSAADMAFDNVIKSSIFVTDINNFGEVNGIYGKYFSGDNVPARETVQVAALPKGVHVEISMIAGK